MNGAYKYIVVRPVKLDKDGQNMIPEGTELSVFRGLVSMNGVMLQAAFQIPFLAFIKQEENVWKSGGVSKYLRKIPF